MTTTKNNLTKSTFLAYSGVLSALSVILQAFNFPLPMFPSFLKIDFADIPAIIGVLFFDFRIGILVSFVKNLVHFILMTSTGGIGELANFIVSVSFLVPFGIVYAKTMHKHKFILSCVVGIISTSIIACFMNYYVLIPFYAELMKKDIQFFIDMSNTIFQNFNLSLEIKSFREFIILSILPFNILKGCIVSIVGFFVYEKLIRPLKLTEKFS